MPGIEYLCVRARGLRDHLFGTAGHAALLARPDLAGRLELLAKSDYAPLLPPGATSARDATRRLRAQVTADAARFLRFLDDPRRRELLAAALALADVFALRTLLRGAQRGAPPAEVLALLEPTSDFDTTALRELAAQRGVKGVIDLLSTWRSPWARALEAAGRGADLLALEVALDRAFLARGFAAARGRGEDARLLVRLLAALVDLANAATLLRMGARRPADLFLEGGHALPFARFRRLAGLDVVAMRATLAADPALALGPGLGEAVQPFLLDRLIQRRWRLLLRREARLAPLSIAVPLLALAEREEDVRRIRLVLEATEAGVPAAEVADLLTEDA
jgi:vacuolar-type H+-ATPase subunit C/Vma6